jgi:predicted amidohydrolase
VAKGAEILCHPTVEQNLAAPDMYDHLKSVRAYENRMYVVSANIGIAYQRHPETGELNRVTTCGHSLIAGPDGNLLASVSGSGEGMATAEIDIEALRKLRETPARDLEFSPVLYQNVYRIK